MGPRGCNYLHFISVIRDGDVIKTPNLSRVKQVPNFKTIEEIYASIRFKCDGSHVKCPPKVDRSLSKPYDCDKVKTKVKIESTEEESEPDFDSMTLKQFQRTCKSKKRKAFPPVNLMAIKQEDIDSKLQEDEVDMKETLGTWKRKLKKAKSRKDISNCVPLSPKIISLSGRSKGIPLDQAQQETSREICKPMRIKVENAQFDYSEPQPISCILPDNLGNATSEILGVVEHSCLDQNIKTTLGGFPSVCLSGTSYEHFVHPISSFLEAQNCSVNPATYEHLENDQLMKHLISGDSKIEDVKKVNDTGGIGDQSLDLAVVELRKEGLTDQMMYDVASVQAQNCVLDRVSYEHVESIQQLQNTLVSGDSKVEDTIEVDGNAVSGDKSLGSPVSELRNEGAMSIPMTFDETPETVFLESDRSDFCDRKPHDTGALRVPCHRDKSIQVQAPWIAPGGICYNSGSTDNEKATCTVDNNKDMEAEVITSVVEDQSSTVESTKCLPLVNNMASRDNVAFAIEDKESSMHHLPCSPDIQPCDSIDSLTGYFASETYQAYVPHPPERLFSARKTISPNSQERLCRAMNSIQIQEDLETQSCRERLSFEKDNKDKSSSPKSDLRRARIIFTSKRHEAVSTTNTRQAMRKAKDERKGPRCKSVAKGPHASHMAQHPARSCSSIQSCSQNAILFSQQQMNDIERLAQKLVTELQSMKDIFVDALQCESRTGPKLRYNTDEVRVAVENATEVEEMTRKWLSMMTRDCNRFCKIMRLAETDGGSEKTANKGRKIMFADEAGGSLCHVKVFEASETGIGFASPVESQIREEALRVQLWNINLLYIVLVVLSAGHSDYFECICHNYCIFLLSLLHEVCIAGL